MADRLPIDLIKIEAVGCPVVFRAAFVDRSVIRGADPMGDRVFSVGQAMSGIDAVRSCLGELAERLSLLSRGEHDPLVSCHVDGHPHISASDALGLTRDQQAALRANHPALAQVSRNGVIEWERVSDRRVDVKCLYSDEAFAVPSLAVLLGETRAFGAKGARITSSTGAAAWSNRQGAVESGVLELVERDAVAGWWRAPSAPLRFSLSDFHHLIPHLLAEWLTGRERDTHFLYLPARARCHVIAALSCDREGRYFAFGTCADLSLAAAVEGAVLELAQTEMHLQNVVELHIGMDEGDIAHPLFQMSRTTRVEDEAWLNGLRGSPSDLDGDGTWDKLVTSLRQNDIPIYVADLTRPEIGVPVIKAISTQLANWNPERDL